MRMPLPIAALLLLLGCSTLSVTTLMKLSRLDFLTVDAHSLRVALQAPEALGLPADGATMTVGAAHPDGREVSERFVLAPVPNGSGCASRQERPCRRILVSVGRR